jgi:hypothetical protein
MFKNIDNIIFLILFLVSLKFPAFLVMLLTTILIHTFIKKTLYDNSLLIFIHLIIIYNIFRRCLQRHIKTDQILPKLKGLATLLNTFNGRKCSEGILCSFMAFGIYLIVFLILSLINNLDYYGFNTPQASLSYITMFAILIIFLTFYSGFKSVKNIF